MSDTFTVQIKEFIGRTPVGTIMYEGESYWPGDIFKMEAEDIKRFRRRLEFVDQAEKAAFEEEYVHFEPEDFLHTAPHGPIDGIQHSIAVGEVDTHLDELQTYEREHKCRRSVLTTIVNRQNRLAATGTQESPED